MRDLETTVNMIHLANMKPGYNANSKAPAIELMLILVALLLAVIVMV